MPNPLDQQRIAIVRLSAIGDVVWTLPLVASIRAAAPGARITWIIHPTPHELIADHPSVDEFMGGGAVVDLRARDLRRLAFLLSAADVFVGPDSGPLHIAVALGTPSVALMGYTNPKLTGPYRFQELMVDAFSERGEPYGADAPPRPGRMRRIAVEEVEANVCTALEPPYSPIRLHPRGPGLH